MTDGLMNPATPTLANGATPAPAAPPAADPGEFGPAVTPAPAPKTFEQRRHAQEQAVAAAANRAAAPTQTEWLRMTPEQRAEHTRAAAAQSEPPSPDAAATGAEKVKIGKFEVSEGEIAAMLERQANDDLRKATIPPTPDAYKLEISPDAKLPGNVEFKFDSNDPGLVAAKAWAHSKGLDQSAFSEMLTLYASHVAQTEAALAAVSRAEIAKAGPNAPQRVDAIGKWIRAEVGDADAKPILATMVTDSHLRFYEKLQQRITSQGTANFSTQHRVPPDDKAIPGYENMSFEQRRFAQDQIAARRRP